MNKQNIWCIEINNYHGEYHVFYFENFEIAKANFDRLAEIHKNYREFVKDEEAMTLSWFDPEYNEYSTYINMIKPTLPIIHDKIIF